jgi:catechol 2,3-dioxygenase-like lactoylglutathione lyase family enzyme
MAEIKPEITKSHRTKKPLIKIEMISHGTLSVVGIQKSRRFYEEVLSFEVIQHAPVGLLIRLGTEHVYVVFEDGQKSPTPREPQRPGPGEQRGRQRGSRHVGEPQGRARPGAHPQAAGSAPDRPNFWLSVPVRTAVCPPAAMPGTSRTMIFWRVPTGTSVAGRAI